MKCISCGEIMDYDEAKSGRDECFICYCEREDFDKHYDPEEHRKFIGDLKKEKALRNLGLR
jgi:hypothetical protein